MDWFQHCSQGWCQKSTNQLGDSQVQCFWAYFCRCFFGPPKFAKTMLLDIFWIGSACVCYLAQIFVFHIFVFIKAKVSWTPVCPGLVLPVFANTPRPLILANSISICYYLNKVIFKYCLILDRSLETTVQHMIPSIEYTSRPF